MGLDIGLEQTGRFQLLAAVEKEKSFCETIRTNRDQGRLNPALAIFQGDIRNIDPAAVLDAAGLKPGELDVLAGGPPCQAFSTAGRRASVEDPRGTLLWDYLRFVDYMKPKFFIMENVRGLLSAALKHRPIAERPEKGGPPLTDDEQPGSVVRLFADDLQKLAERYHMDCFEVNAVNYGAPQLRERAIFIGNRFNEQVDFPDPTHGNPSDLTGAPDDLFSYSAQTLLPWTNLDEVLRTVAHDDGEVMDFSPRKKGFLDKIPPGSNWRSLPIEDQQVSMGKAWFAKGGRSGWWRRLTLDLPSPTLVTMPNHASTSLCHPTETRALTLREYAAIQEFPSDWTFAGTTSQKYAQVGNAVPVRLGKVAGQVVADALDRLSARGNVPAAEAPAAYRVLYVQSHVRTRQWFKGGKTVVWGDGEANGDAQYALPVTARREKRMAGA